MFHKILLLLAFVFVVTYAYPSGAPQSTCQIFTANHSDHLPQRSQAPYNIVVSPTTVTPRSKATVTIESVGANRFKGFFIQGQDSRTKKSVGKFTRKADAQTRDCGEQGSDAATHTNRNDKSRVVLEWTAPSSYKGNVIFRAVIVKTYQQYWDNVRSSSITVA